MQSANRRSETGQGQEGIRIAGQEDAVAITKLLREASFSHIHADWHYPDQWLGIDSFVVLPAPEQVRAEHTLSSKFFGSQKLLEACLAVAADPQPAAWVRLAAVFDRRKVRSTMAVMFSAIEESLRKAGTNQIAWLLLEEWPETWLPASGFERINEVITYVKQGTHLPPLSRPPDLQIRPVEQADLAALAAIESRAFEPLWQHSELGLSLAKQQAFSFDVAWYGERPVGFQFSSSTRQGAHLSRITVDAEVQHSGVGTALLAHALEGYYRQGISTATLNTQSDNIASRNLYERFGFAQSGERFPVWSLNLT